MAHGVTTSPCPWDPLTPAGGLAGWPWTRMNGVRFQVHGQSSIFHLGAPANVTVHVKRHIRILAHMGFTAEKRQELVGRFRRSYTGDESVRRKIVCLLFFRFYI